MGILKNLFPRLIDDSERQMSSLIKAIDDFDLDSTIDAVMESGKNAIAGFNDFIKTVKDTVSDFKVIIPFNEKTEKFNINVEDGVITVKVTGKGTRRETTATIPSNCLVDDIKHFIDKKNGNLVVVIPKDLSEDETLKKAKSTVTKTVTNTANWLKDALKERAEAVAASTTAPTSKPKGGKKTAARKPQPKVVRGADGKFKSAKS
jgi:hypothetical protein